MSRLARLATIIRIIGHYRLDELVDPQDVSDEGGDGLGVGRYRGQ